MTTTERAAPLRTSQQDREAWEATLTSALRTGVDARTPGQLLATASMLLDIAAGASAPDAVARVIRGLAAGNRPEHSAGALAMAAVAGDDGLRRELRRNAADHGHPVPRWLAQLHRAAPIDRAVELGTPFRDVDELLVGVTVPGGHALTAVVRVDNELGVRAVAGSVVERPLDVVVQQVQDDDPDVRVRDIAPADAGARLTHALRGPDLDRLRGEATPWQRVRPLVAWVISLLPDGGDATVPGTCEDVDLDGVAADFLASSWGRPWIRSGLPLLVEAVLDDGLANGLGDPLLWAPHHVRRLLDPDGFALDVDTVHADRAPELLRDLIRHGHSERGLREGLTDESLAAVDRAAGPFLDAVRAREAAEL